YRSSKIIVESRSALGATFESCGNVACARTRVVLLATKPEKTKSKENQVSFMKRTPFFLGALLFMSVAGTLSAQITNVIFSDDFESGTLANWTTTSASTPSPLDPSTVTNVVPPSPAGQWSAYMNISTDRMHHNI